MKKAPILMFAILAALTLGPPLARATGENTGTDPECKNLSDADVKVTDCDGADCGTGVAKKDVGAQTITGGNKKPKK
ncbi:MAG: hypothetical protein HYW49_05295 [Deltaproteobacteria bacterium]|nr:hypothetical protein [Deltaproteobacteria bacterium]